MLTTQQLIERQSGIGGSDAAGILGISPWSTPYSVWKSKVEPIAEVALPSNGPLYWGSALEDVVRMEFAKRNRVVVSKPDETLFRHPDRPWMIANVDGIIMEMPTVSAQWNSLKPTKWGLEIKTANEFAAKAWGGKEENDNDDDDTVPDYYLVQGMHYCAVMGWDKVSFAVLIGGNAYKEYTINADQSIIDDLIEAERGFWHDFVLPKIPPPMTAEECNIAMSRAKPGSFAVADRAVVEACRRLHHDRSWIREIEKQASSSEAVIKNFLEEREQLMTEDGRLLASWANNNDGLSFDEKQFAKDHPELYASFLKTKPGARVLRIKEKSL